MELAVNLLIRWLPGLIFALVLFSISRRYQHFLAIPACLVAALCMFYIALWLTSTTIEQASLQGWMLGPFPEQGLWHPLSPLALTQVNLAVILSQSGHMASLMILCAIDILFSVSGLELIAHRDIDPNRELKTAGLANLVSGGIGGMVGSHVLDSSAIAYTMGGRSRLTGLISTLPYIVVILLGSQILSFFPKAFFGGLLLFLGFYFLVEWLWDARCRLPKTDYSIVWLILLAMMTVGFLQGVGIGLIVAIVLFVIDYSQVKVARHTLSGATYRSHAARSLQQSRLLNSEGEQIYILELQGFLFFGTANKLLNQIRQRFSQTNLLPLKYVVFSFYAVTGLDSSTVLSFTKLQQLAQQQQFKLVFTHLSATIYRQLQQGGCLKNQDCQVFPDLDRGVEWCENQILDAIPQRRRRSLPLVLQLNDLFKDATHIPAFINYLEALDMEAGQIVFAQGDAADFLYFLEVGEVTVLSALETGQPRRLQSLGAGNLVGEMDFFLQSPHQTWATVDQPSTLYRLSQDALKRMHLEQPEVAAAFQEFVIRLLSERLTHSDRLVRDRSV